MKLLRSYFFWTYERGSLHYDVMVTLILAFIFLTPRIWNYGDHPQPDKSARGNVLVNVDGPGQLSYEVPASRIQPGDTVDKQLEQSIQAISGPVTMDRYQVLQEPRGKVTGYRVWAHR
ncbi:hypothetical protein [Silvibacterium acidisoli]|uniref:hypothetical protein n=1 Tax=Acidobacteriaceae bacterium ZG23-2 TaxID=2883246 RepID=UPI00406C95E9